MNCIQNFITLIISDNINIILKLNKFYNIKLKYNFKLLKKDNSLNEKKDVSSSSNESLKNIWTRKNVEK